jgi:TolA-binding protein
MNNRFWLSVAIVAGFIVLASSGGSMAHAQGYQPSRPTVSPYLNLFQNNRNGQLNRALPNYYTLVRPQLQQQQVNQTQQQLLQQQNGTIEQLQGTVQILQQQKTGRQVVTGHGSAFMNTSRYYAQAGTAGQHAQGSSGTTSFSRR